MKEPPREIRRDIRPAPKPKRPTTLKDALQGKLPSAIIEQIPRAFDIVGTIAVIEIPAELEGYEKIIGETLLSITPQIQTVAKKVGGHTGRYRRQKVRILAGRRTKTTIHSENGARMKVNVETAYFSPRLSTERGRVAALVKPGERVLVMFSGIAPYPLTIARTRKAAHIVGIEMNPKGHALGLESMQLNKTISPTIDLYRGDVRKVVPSLNETFDRIIMPLPKSAKGFLGLALSVAKPGAIIHYYEFAKEEEIKDLAASIVEEIERLGRKATAIATITCGQAGIREFRVCVDLKIDD